jgi:outer membrane protein OmpA-like peptidoglycan-associated protein
MPEPATAPAPKEEPKPAMVAAVAPPPPPPAPVAPAAPAQVATSPAAEAAPTAGQQLASLAPANVGSDGRLAIVSFQTGTADLPEAARTLLERTAAEMKRDENARLQLVAYAAGNEDASSQARRLSLSRALAVRSYLIEHGVRSTRMDVRALGNKVPEGPPDRVDVMLVRR